MKKLMFVFALILGVSLFANKEVTETDRFYELDIEFEVPVVDITKSTTTLVMKKYQLKGILVLFDPNVDRYAIRSTPYVSKSVALYYTLTGTREVNTLSGKNFSTSAVMNPKAFCMTFTDRGPQLSFDLPLGNTVSVLTPDGALEKVNEFGYANTGCNVSVVMDVQQEWNPLYGEWEFSEGAGQCYATLGTIFETRSLMLTYGLDKSMRSDCNRRYASRGFGTARLKRTEYRKINDLREELRAMFAPKH